MFFERITRLYFRYTIVMSSDYFCLPLPPPPARFFFDYAFHVYCTPVILALGPGATVLFWEFRIRTTTHGRNAVVRARKRGSEAKQFKSRRYLSLNVP